MKHYDETEAKSIEAHALKLLNKSLRDVLGSEIEQKRSGKGKFGQIVEELYFGYKPNSNPEPDFPKAGVELKTSPLKKIKRGLVSKERLVFNNINFKEEHKYTFETSTFWRKNRLLLLMFFLFEEGKLDLDYIFKIIRLWEFPETDLKIIKDDWEKIVGKIRTGRAHELSEGDTLYLGACPKGANKRSLQEQPFSEIMAMKRAFSLKQKYLNFIIEKSLPKEIESEPVVKRLGEYQKNQSFEDLIIQRFKPYFGMTYEEMTKKLNIPRSNAKSKYYLLAKAILGVKKDKIEEFEKADIEMKTIRLERSGALKESMSFAQIKFTEIVNEEWEESYWFNTLTKRFFFVVFQKDAMGNLRLKSVKFWTMPANDLSTAKCFWAHTQRQILNDKYKNFLKISDDMICHVRPKGRNSKDKAATPSGRREKKKCYWLNGSYIRKIIEDS